MKNYTESQVATIAAAATAIQAAALESITAIVTAKAALTIVIRQQVTALEKAGILQKDIAVIVRCNVANAASPSHISRTLTSCGVRLRSKTRSDAGFLRMADAALDASKEEELTEADEAEAPAAEAPAAEAEADDDQDGEGGGHTAETLAALLRSINPDIVADALELAGLTPLAAPTRWFSELVG